MKWKYKMNLTSCNDYFGLLVKVKIEERDLTK